MMEGIKEIATIISLATASIASITVAVKNIHEIKKDKKKQKPKQRKRKRK